ncbi:hypothetical protein [Gluconobacter oxydans]|uniref:hypothetical protein n=1 Tax=Gluconobacter oxydans TaxID=442 RepID=UPI00128C97CD|nr:hypothetical protein [Gluconobacter oxydans]
MSRPPSFPDSWKGVVTVVLGRANCLNVSENCHSLPRNLARPVLRRVVPVVPERGKWMMAARLARLPKVRS